MFSIARRGDVCLFSPDDTAFKVLDAQQQAGLQARSREDDHGQAALMD
jgi:hypothetical protein